MIHAILGTSLSANELRVYPADVALHGVDSSQRLVVVSEKDGVALDEWTARARWTSSNPAVARVEADATVRAVGDGEATLTAEVEGKTATAKVKAR